MSGPNWWGMLLNGLYYASAGIWTGAILMLSVGARVAFRILPDRKVAGDVVGGWIQSYHKLGLACALGLAAAALLRSRLWEAQLWQGPWCPAKAVATVRYACVALMILNHLYTVFVLHPELHQLREAGQMEAFRALHGRSVALLAGNLLLGILAILLA